MLGCSKGTPSPLCSGVGSSRRGWCVHPCGRSVRRKRPSNSLSATERLGPGPVECIPQLNTPFELERQSPRWRQAGGGGGSNSPRETLRPTYRSGEATLESGRSTSAPKVEAVQLAVRLSGPVTERGGRPTSTAPCAEHVRRSPVTKQQAGNRSEVLE